MIVKTLGRVDYAPTEQAMREFTEEVGCPLHAPFIVDVVEESLLGARNVVHIVAGTVGGAPIPDRREVIAAAFFTASELPEDMPRVLQGRLPRWIREAIAARHRDAGAAPAPPQGRTG